MTPAAFADMLDVSRETLERLVCYWRLLLTWQRRINLVGTSTLDNPWQRHFLDSGQLHQHIPASGTIVDLGTGAGFPGLVLAIMRAQPIHLIESDKRKAAFLREAVRATDCPHAVVHARRIEETSLLADHITARALAPVDRLLALGSHVATPAARYVLLKGRECDSELTMARARWNMTVQIVPSLSDPRGQILMIDQVSRIDG